MANTKQVDKHNNSWVCQFRPVT